MVLRKKCSTCKQYMKNCKCTSNSFLINGNIKRSVGKSRNIMSNFTPRDVNTIRRLLAEMRNGDYYNNESDNESEYYYDADDDNDEGYFDYVDDGDGTYY